MIPDDLVSLLSVVEDPHTPARKWWSARIREGDLATYHIPGKRGLFVSRSDVERVLRPQQLPLRPPPKQEPTE